MKTIVIGGFLGSGKTTCLLSLAKWLTGRGESVVILENEIGEVGVDDAIIRSAGLKVREIFAGCVCCTAAGELTTAAGKIKEDIAPDWLIIETTGVASLELIRENLSHAIGETPLIIAVADAARWKKIVFAMESLLGSQIGYADFVLLNKCDTKDDTALSETEEDLRDFGGHKIYRVTAEDGIDSRIWENIVFGEKHA